MKRKRRDFDGEADEESHPNQMLKAPAPLIERPDRQNLRAVLAGLCDQGRHVESMRLRREIERQDRQQHQDAAKKGVEKKLDRRVLAPGAAPYSDQEIHGQ